MITTLVEKAIQSLKHDTNYKVDPTINDRIMSQILWYRGISLLRGEWYKIWLRQKKSVLFVGRNVHLHHPQLISVGRSVIIEDQVTIDALSSEGITLGDNVTIAKFTTIQCTGVIRRVGVGLKVGNNSAIGAYSFLGAQGGIQIGANVIMGPGVSFHAENHQYQDLQTPIRLQGETRQGIIVDDDCWIGAKSTILDGVHIQKESVVAAGSVVTKNVPAGSIVAGVPAKVLRSRYGEHDDRRSNG